MRKIAYRLANTILVLLLLAVPVLNLDTAEAAEVTNRSISLANSRASVSTQHQLRFDYMTAASTGSIEVEYCSNGPILGTPCTVPAGLNLLGAVLSSESGETGFSIHGNTTANRLVLTRAAAAVTPQSASYLMSNVVNPSAVGTFYARVGTFASTDGTGGRIDQGGLALSTTQPINVGAYVPPVLLFCLGVSVPTNNCASAVGDNIDFGDFTTVSPSFGTTQMLGATNGYGGYTITIFGTTMTSGNNTIPGLTAKTASSPGTSQFGVNLVDNSSPNVGVNVSGNGTGFATSNYNTANQFRFASGDVVARSTTSSDINRYTTSYLVNIADSQNPGVYATTLTYIALAAF